MQLSVSNIRREGESEIHQSEGEGEEPNVAHIAGQVRSAPPACCRKSHWQRPQSPERFLLGWEGEEALSTTEGPHLMSVKIWIVHRVI